METLKRIISKTTTTEIEIEFNLPHFRKYDNSYFKIMSENWQMKVATYEFMPTIEAGNYYLPASFLEGSTEITKEEFDAAYEVALNKLIETKNR